MKASAGDLVNFAVRLRTTRQRCDDVILSQYLGFVIACRRETGIGWRSARLVATEVQHFENVN